MFVPECIATSSVKKNPSTIADEATEMIILVSVSKMIDKEIVCCL